MSNTEFPTRADAGQASAAGGETAEASPLENFLRSPLLAIPVPGRPAMRLATDHVRGRPAVAPRLSMMIGMTAIGLGLWGALFPRSVKRRLGVVASPLTVRALFGARELWSGVSLVGDPTRTEVLWARVAADMVDLAVLGSLGRHGRRRRKTARAALAAVAAITALDVGTAYRMSTVRRNCA